MKGLSGSHSTREYYIPHPWLLGNGIQTLYFDIVANQRKRQSFRWDLYGFVGFDL